jgi:hypothetical protein
MVTMPSSTADGRTAASQGPSLPDRGGQIASNYGATRVRGCGGWLTMLVAAAAVSACGGNRGLGVDGASSDAGDASAREDAPARVDTPASRDATDAGMDSVPSTDSRLVLAPDALAPAPTPDGAADADDAKAPTDERSEQGADVEEDVALDAATEVGLDAPTAETESDVAEPLSGACLLHDALTPIPTASHDNDGTGFRKLMIPGVDDIPTLQQRCTLDVYGAMVPSYCLTGNVGPVTYEVVSYASDGSIAATACAVAGCGPYDVATIGACTIRDGDLPAWNAPDVGADYARKLLPGVGDFDALRVACTPAIYDQLIAEYCALGRPDIGFLRELDIYNPDVQTGMDMSWEAGGGFDGATVEHCPAP